MAGTNGSKNSFYNSRAWKAERYRALHRSGYKCAQCGKCLRGKGASRVDHIKPLNSNPELALEQSNLQTLCPACDNKKHREKGYKPREVDRVNPNGAPDGWLDI